MKTARRFLALLLVLAMLLPNLPVTVLADELTGPVTEETITEETTQTPSGEATQAPAEEETSVPSEQPTEAPEEETEAPSEETEAPTEESTEAPTEEVEPIVGAASVEDEEIPEAELIFRFLTPGTDNIWYEEEGAAEQCNLSELPFDPYYVIFYAKEWNGETWEYTPVYGSDLEYDRNLLTITTLSPSECSGDKSDYYVVIDPYDDQWDKNSSIRYTLPDETVVSMDVWIGRSLGEFYSVPAYNNETVIIHYTIDPDAENTIYYYFDSNDYWTLESIEIEQDYADYFTKEELSTSGQREMKFTLTQAGMESKNWWRIRLYPTVSHTETDPVSGETIKTTDRWVNTVWINPADTEIHDPYLTFGWLSHNGEGWCEPEDRNEKMANAFRVMPSQEMYQIYYLNWWDDSIGDYSQSPVCVQPSGGDLTFEQVTQDAAPGQENADYFYRVTTNTWDQEIEVLCPLLEGGTVGGVTVLTERNELSAYRSFEMSNDACVIDSYAVDLTEGAENELYVGFASDYWTCSGDFRVEDYCQDWISLEDTDNVNVKRVRISQSAMEALGRKESLWVGVSVNAQGENNEEMTTSCGFRLEADLSSASPYLTFGWLDNWGEGFFEQEDHNCEGMSITPGDTFFLIFYLNHWDDAQDCMVQTPVRVQGGDHVTVGSVSDIAEGQENGEYFCSVSTDDDSWDQTVEVYYMMDGTRVSMEIWSGRGELGFYNAPEMSNQTWHSSGPVEIDPFEENCIYLGLDRGGFTVQNVFVNDDSATDYVDITQVEGNANLYKLTLTDAGLNRMMNQYLLGISLAVKIVNDADENWVETWYAYIDFSRMQLQSAAWIFLNDEPYELFAKGDQLLWNHCKRTGEQDEWGNDILENEVVDSLPQGLSYDLAANKLTMEDYHGESIDISYHNYDEFQDTHFYNLPNGNLTVELIGQNSLVSDVRAAVSFSGDLNVTFTGDGSLYVKSTNSPDNLDWEGHPFSYPAMRVDSGSVTFADSVNITVEIAGQGLEDCWDENGYLGSRTAHLNALDAYNADITLKDSATLTTLVPQGAKSNGPLLDEPDFFGDNTPGGYSGINGYNSLTVSGGTLNTSDLKVDYGWDESGKVISSTYTQTGGTVNIEALGYNSLTDIFEWNEETQQDEYVDTVPDSHYAGLEVLWGSVANISGGELNITVTPTDAEMASSSYFVGIAARGGSLNLSGGEINFTTAGNGCGLEISNEYDENGEVSASGDFRMTGGTVNIHGSEDHVFDAIFQQEGSTMEMNGGTINTSWTNCVLCGEVTIDGAALNVSHGQMEFNGKCAMNGGTIDIDDGLIVVNNALMHNGGEIRIDNDREGLSWASLVVRAYYAISNDAKLTIRHNMWPCAVAVEGCFHQMGGIVDITHNSDYTESQEAAVQVTTYWDEENNQEHTGSLLLNDGVFNIRSFDGCHNVGLRVDEGSAFFVGAQEDGHHPVLNLTEMDMELNGTSDILRNAEVNVNEGQVLLDQHAVFTMDVNPVFTVETSMELDEREEDAWYFAFNGQNGSEINIYDGTLTVNSHNYDTAFLACGQYTQTGGTVNATATSEDLERANVCVAFNANGTARIEGGVMNLTSDDTAFGLDPDPQSNDDLVISGGTFNLHSNKGGIWLTGKTEISGGDFNITVDGVETEAVDENGESLGKYLNGWGICVYGVDNSKASLTITGGDFDIQLPVDSEDQISFNTRGIWAHLAPVSLLGGTFHIDSHSSISLWNVNAKPSFTLGDDLGIYSTKTGAKLELVTSHWTDGEDEWYYSTLEEDNVAGDPITGEGIDYAGCIVIETKKAGIDLTADKTTLKFGEKATLTATVSNCDDPNVKITWTLGAGDQNYVTLKDNKDGTATVTAKKNTVLREVTVTAATNLDQVEPASVTLTVIPVAAKVSILNDEGDDITGTTQTLYMSTGGDNSMSLFARNTPEESVQAWTWKSSNAKYATVDSDGIVTAVTAGKTVTITATATDGSGKSATVKIKTVQPMEEILMEEYAVLASGKSLTLKAEVYPSDTTNKKLTWEILDGGTEFATISSTGKLTAKKVEGIQEIWVRVSAAEDPSVYADCLVSIHPAVTAVNIYSPDVTDIEGPLNGKTITLYMSSDPEDARNTLDLDAENDPADSAQEWTWKSSAAQYADVDEEGVVTALTPGKTVTITATANDGTGKKATVKIQTVQPMEEVTLPETAAVAAGKTISLTAQIYPSNTTNQKLVWEVVSGAEYASVSGGKVKAAKTLDEIKTVTVRVSAAENADVYDECEVTLYPTAVDKVDIQDGDGNSLTGSTVTLIMATDSDNTLDLDTVSFAKDLVSEVAQEVTWKSSDTKSATVDEEGVVTVLVPGKTVTITATAADGSGKKATVKIKGVQPMETLTLKENLVLDVYGNPIIAGGKALKLTTAVDIYPSNTSNPKLTWSVADNEYGITVNASTGVLSTRAVTEHVSVEVTAAAQDGSGVDLTFEVSVYPATTKVTLANGGSDVTGKTLTLPAGATAVLEAVCTPDNAAGEYTWTSSDAKSATVNEDGEVTGLVAGKTVTITCTAADGSGKKATVKFKILAAE